MDEPVEEITETQKHYTQQKLEFKKQRYQERLNKKQDKKLPSKPEGRTENSIEEESRDKL